MIRQRGTAQDTSAIHKIRGGDTLRLNCKAEHQSLLWNLRRAIVYAVNHVMSGLSVDSAADALGSTEYLFDSTA